MNRVQPGSFLTLHYRLPAPTARTSSTPSTTSRRRSRSAPASSRRRWKRACSAWPRARRRSFELAAGEAFGERNPELLQRVKRALLDELGDPDARLPRSATWCSSRRPTAQGAYAGVVREVGGDWLLFDFNHPLAGRPVTFEVQLIGVL